MYIYIYIYIYICIFIHVCLYVCINVYVYIHIHIYIYKNVCKYTWRCRGHRCRAPSRFSGTLNLDLDTLHLRWWSHWWSNTRPRTWMQGAVEIFRSPAYCTAEFEFAVRRMPNLLYSGKPKCLRRNPSPLTLISTPYAPADSGTSCPQNVEVFFMALFL
jgi:hypothetical protein